MSNSQSNGAGIVAPASDTPFDVSDRSQRWVLVYEDRFGGYVGQLVDRAQSPQSNIQLKNVFAYDKRLVIFGGPVVTGPGQANIIKGPAEEQRNVWDFDHVKPEDVITVMNPRLVVQLADASLETRTMLNQAISMIENARKAQLSAKTGLDLSGRIDPALAAVMKRPG